VYAQRYPHELWITKIVPHRVRISRGDTGAERGVHEILFKTFALPIRTPQAKVCADLSPVRGDNKLLAIVQAAGWPIYFLLLASVIAVALIIERFIILRKEKIVPTGLLDRVLAAYQREGLSDEMLDKLAADSPLGQVLAAGMRNVRSSRYVMKDAIEEAGRAVTHELGRFLTTLGTIATISPLMGLFGTVVGMIEIFGSQSPTGTNPIQLAHGISVALYNTGFGLVIAIPAMIFFRHFRAKVETFVVEMEQQAAKLVDVVHGQRFDFQPPPGAEG
jgi:biopolymer transport protein ExbB